MDVEIAQCSICNAEVGEPHNIDAHDLQELREATREYEDNHSFPF